MEKMVKNQDILNLGNFFVKNWDSAMKETKLNSRSLYNLIRLKKTILPIAESIQETVIEIAKSHGGEVMETGGVKVPDDKIQETNTAIGEFLEGEDTVHYQTITMSDDDSLSPDLMEVIFDFIEFKD